MRFIPLLLCVSLQFGDILSAHGIANTSVGRQLTARAKDKIASAFSQEQFTARRKSLYLEEVLPYAPYFVDDKGEPRIAETKAYVEFGTEGLATLDEEGKRVVPLCLRIEADPACPECVAVKEEFTKYLPKRLSRRGYQVRPLPPEEAAIDGASTHELPDVASVDAFQRFFARALGAECLHVFSVGIASGDRGAIKAMFYMDVKDMGKRRHRAGYQTSEKAAAPKEELLYPPSAALLVKGVAALFSELGEKLSRESRQATDMVAGNEKILVLEGVRNFADYQLFKKKLVDGVEGLTTLEERGMKPGRIEFVVVGVVPLSTLSTMLVQTVGPEPVIDSLKLENELLLRVVLK